MANTLFTFNKDYYATDNEIELEMIIASGFVNDIIEQMFVKEDPALTTKMLENDPELREKEESYLASPMNELGMINQLNYPQRMAAVNHQLYGNLVIQGPPGTGKTELIVSLISDAMMRGKRVLVSTKKQVALEVIYSRLKELTKYALMLHNVEDTTYFYEQISYMIAQAREDIILAPKDTKKLMEDRYASIKEIKGIFNKYGGVFEYMSKNEIGAPNHYLYKNHFAYKTDDKNIQTLLEQPRFYERLLREGLVNKQLYKKLLAFRDSRLFDAGEKDIKPIEMDYP